MNTDKLGLPLWRDLSIQQGVFDMIMAGCYIVENPSMAQFYEGLEDALYAVTNRPLVAYLKNLMRQGVAR